MVWFGGVMYEELVGKSVRLTKRGGWVMWGIVEKVEGGVLKLQFEYEDRAEYIAVDIIESIIERVPVK